MASPPSTTERLVEQLCRDMPRNNEPRTGKRSEVHGSMFHGMLRTMNNMVQAIPKNSFTKRYVHVRVLNWLRCTTEMANTTNSLDYVWSYEYYMGYLDLPSVDATKLKAHRYSIVIAFWIGLAAFVAFLFFILFCISQTGYTSIKNGRPHKTFPWNYSKNKHQDVVTNHAGRTLTENQVEETEDSSLSRVQK
ncbi:melanocortin-2 receptor accessory protein [Eublepharis macularius]|uniref:Melanocortin-2 receptor accessory protein n=1 Tax=Eublepharis macularius TaxID=481883 RepID=A0AA97J3I1_EUBMA|nr:melanocortin-2 receptor accessory protein [Eublepharis macularius]